jgi:hypothetical protein
MVIHSFDPFKQSIQTQVQLQVPAHEVKPANIGIIFTILFRIRGQGQMWDSKDSVLSEKQCPGNPKGKAEATQLQKELAAAMNPQKRN